MGHLASRRRAVHGRNTWGRRQGGGGREIKHLFLDQRAVVVRVLCMLCCDDLHAVLWSKVMASVLLLPRLRRHSSLHGLQAQRPALQGEAERHQAGGRRVWPRVEQLQGMPLPSGCRQSAGREAGGRQLRGWKEGLAGCTPAAELRRTAHARQPAAGFPPQRSRCRSPQPSPSPRTHAHSRLICSARGSQRCSRWSRRGPSAWLATCSVTASVQGLPLSWAMTSCRWQQWVHFLIGG